MVSKAAGVPKRKYRRNNANGCINTRPLIILFKASAAASLLYSQPPSLITAIPIESLSSR